MIALPAACDVHLGHLAERAFAARGDYDAVFFEGAWHSSAVLLERACRIGAGLVRDGLAPGDRVVVTMPNTPEVPVLYNAIWRAGGVVTPAMFLLSVPDLRHVVSDAGAHIVVTSRDFAANVRAATAGLQDVIVVCVEPDVPGTIALAELEASEPGGIVARAPQDIAALLYTGGTTGRAKGVMLSHENLAFASQVGAAYEAELRLGRELMVLPLSHSFGLMATLGALQSREPKVWVMLRRFDAAAAIGLIEGHAVDELQAVPSMIQMLLSQPLEEFDLSSLRVIFSGGAALAAEVLHEFKQRVPSASILEGYGLTESSTLLTATPPGREKPGSVGTALTGVEVRVVDLEGRPMTRGEVGEICTRSKAVMLGYWNAREQTATVLTDGWLATGDIGYVDEDGFVFILDRKKDLIIRGGFNVYPRDVEDSMLEHPAIHMAAVIGKPDVTHGEEVLAFVTLNAGANACGEELVAWGRERIGGYKYPREVRVLEAMPLTDVGKTDRKALRALVD